VIVQRAFSAASFGRSPAANTEHTFLVSMPQRHSSTRLAYGVGISRYYLEHPRPLIDGCRFEGRHGLSAPTTEKAVASEEPFELQAEQLLASTSLLNKGSTVFPSGGISGGPYPPRVKSATNGRISFRIWKLVDQTALTIRLPVVTLPQRPKPDGPLHDLRKRETARRKLSVFELLTARFWSRKTFKLRELLGAGPTADHP